MMGDGPSKILTPKTTPITDDYRLSNTVLGLGINGKVMECYSKKDGHKYALKVMTNRHIVDVLLCII